MKVCETTIVKKILFFTGKSRGIRGIYEKIASMDWMEQKKRDLR